MKEGDLVKLRAGRHTIEFAGIPENVGLIIEMQARGPVPGAYVLWSNSRTTDWVSIESLEKVESVVSR
jgi:hypothetical protein